MRRRPKSSVWRNADYRPSRITPGKKTAVVKRDAGDVLTPQFMEELRKQGVRQDSYDTMIELSRQSRIAEQIHGKNELEAFLDPANPSQTTEQQIGRQLVFDGQMPENIPPDRIIGSHVTPNGVLGIDGGFKSDSEVRRHTDAVMLQDALDVLRSDVRTEVLSPDSIRDVYDKWADNAFRGQTSIGHFNAAAGEYYGQQALKLKGYSAPSDENRSFASKKAADRRNEATTVGSQRLIENSRQLTDKDVSQSADFRVTYPDGSVNAIDYQMGDKLDLPTVNLNVLKGSNITADSLPQVEREMVRVAQQLETYGIKPDMDLIMTQLQKEGILAPTVMTSIEKGTRAGKFMSNAANIGQLNKDDQHRMAGVLYGLSSPGKMSEMYGMLPDEFRYYDSEDVRNYLGSQYAKGGDNLRAFTKNRTGMPGNLYYNVDTAGQPGGLLNESTNLQFSEPYTFGDVSNVARPKSAFDEVPF
jgi:hypothetical protein